MIEVTIVKIVNIFLTNKNIKWINKFVDKITIFQLDYLMQLKRLEKNIILWLIVRTIQQRI